MHSKKLEFEKLHNVRDLCDIRNKEGFFIRQNKLIRGIRLSDASEKDLKDLYEKYDVKTIVDFRTLTEKYELKDPLYKDTKYLDLIVQEENTVGVSQDEESIKKMKAYFEELDEKKKDKNFLIEHMCNFYYSMANDFASKQYGTFIEEVLNADDAIYWHCSLGRDRCGIGTALILECLDVDRKDIIEDYLYTNECNNDDDFRQKAYKEYIEAYYNGIIDVYGSVDNLFKFMGINEEKKRLLKDKYLEK